MSRWEDADVIPCDTYMKTVMKSFRRVHENMGDGNPVIVAVDGSEHSKKAFECKLYMITRLPLIIISFLSQTALRKSWSLINECTLITKRAS